MCENPPISVTKTNLVEGASMGSPLSPIQANIFLENLEDNAISTPPPFKPSLWCTFLHYGLIQHNNTSHLNKQNMSIQFTTEEENNNKLSFLDVEIEREWSLHHINLQKQNTH